VTSVTSNIFVDSQVGEQVIAIIENARQEVILVTPYLDLWGHAQNAIQRAIGRGVQVLLFIRSGQDNPPLKDIKWLLENKVTIGVLDRLHAKIYMNESTVLLSSMNFTESSALNSLEIAYLVRGAEDVLRVREYVVRDLNPLASQVLLEELEALLSVQGRTPIGSISQTIGFAFCIRCGEHRAFDPDRPLCDDCYDVWAEYENEDYREKVCHSCGQPTQVSKARPLCGPCYARLH
jgi:hypothetical protein